MSRTTIVLLSVGGYFVLCGIGWYRGCASAALPPAPTTAEIALVRKTITDVPLQYQNFRD